MMTMVQNESHTRMSGGGAASRPAENFRPSDSQAPRDGEAEPSSPDAPAAAKTKAKAKPKRRSRFTAWWFARKVIVLALFVGALTGGLYLGFVVLGKGSMDDAFDFGVYKHIYDLIFADS